MYCLHILTRVCADRRVLLVCSVYYKLYKISEV
uniref:Uncharacterized protein n=1 Tax=Arundo donax TaxID=35708 RepID=A0A0A9TH78_ARUDO